MKFLTKTLLSLFALLQIINRVYSRHTNSKSKKTKSKRTGGTYAVSHTRSLGKHKKQFDFLEETRVLAVSPPGQPIVITPPKPSPQPRVSAADIQGLFSLNKEFSFGYKTVSCYRINAQVDYNRYLNFDQKLGKRWWKPSNSNEGNAIISFYKQNYNQQGLDAGYTWIVTYGVETRPNERKVNGFQLNTDAASGWGNGDDGMPGRANGRGWTVFRQWATSFCYPAQWGKFTCWDTSLRYAILCLE